MDIIVNFLKELVLEALENDLIWLFEFAYQGMNDTKEMLTITPAGWMDGRIYAFIKSIQENVMNPVAAAIITFCLAAEIYHIVIEKNQMKEVDVSALMMLFFKIIICLLVVSNSLKIVNGIFELGNWVVGRTVDIVSNDVGTPEDLAGQVVDAIRSDAGIRFWECLNYWLNITIFRWVFIVVNTISFVVVYGRLMQMILYAAFGPVPLATFLNKDWNVGQNYIKNLMALAFQGFLIILIYGIYTILISTPPTFDHASYFAVEKYILEFLSYGVLLVISLTKTNSITQSIFGAH